MTPTELPPSVPGGRYDVAVVGGGLAGVVAAIASARTGASTLLAEALAFPGGNGTIGLPLTSFRARNALPVVVRGVALEMLERLRLRGGCASDPEVNDWMPIDCEQLQLLIGEMLAESGVTLLCQAPLFSAAREGGRITRVAFLCRGSLVVCEAACYVDASGDAALAASAGVPTPMGRARDGLVQPMTLTFATREVDIAAFRAAGGAALLGPLWEKLRPEAAWRNPRSGASLSWPTEIPGRPGELSWNVTRILVGKGMHPSQLAQAELEGRRQVEEFIERFLRPHVPGFAACRLSSIGKQVGVRETRRIEGEYELTPEDLLACRKFPDAVAYNSYPIDIHSPDGGGTRYETAEIPEGGYYSIPLRSLIARGVENLFAAGRCICASHEALAAVRVLSAAMATGQAAGTAAALCAREGTAAQDLDARKLRATLKAAGAFID